MCRYSCQPKPLGEVIKEQKNKAKEFYVNPEQINPVLPEDERCYVNRDWVEPGIIEENKQLVTELREMRDKLNEIIYKLDLKSYNDRMSIKR